MDSVPVAVQEMIAQYNGHKEPAPIVAVKVVVPEQTVSVQVDIPSAVLELLNHYESKVESIKPMPLVPINPNSVPLETPIPKTYNRLALIKERHQLMKKEATGAPQQGPWYMIYLKPNWVLKAMPYKHNEQHVDHVDYWRTLVDLEIVPHYKIRNSDVIRQLYEIPYSQPRGRVQDMSAVGRRNWVAYYGIDFKYSQAQKNTILSAFNLLGQAHAGLVRFEPDSHEIMIQEDFDTFQDLIGRLDIKEISKINIQEAPIDEFDDDK